MQFIMKGGLEMNFLELTRARKSIRKFKADSIPMDKLMKLLEAARTAPSAGNRQPWHFYVIRDEDMKDKIYNLACKQPCIASAPVHIVVCADFPKTTDRYGDRGKDLYSIQDTAAAIQNLLLCATSEDLATCWCGAFDENVTAEILGLSADMRPIAIIPIGYADDTPKDRGRRSIEEISTFIGFNTEYS